MAKQTAKSRAAQGKAPQTRKVKTTPYTAEACAIASLNAPITLRTVKLAHLLARITAEHITTLPKAS